MLPYLTISALSDLHQALGNYFSRECGTYTVTVPALPGIVTQGDTLEEAIAMGRDAIRCHIEGLLKDGEPIPVEAEPLQVVRVEVAA